MGWTQKDESKHQWLFMWIQKLCTPHRWSNTYFLQTLKVITKPVSSICCIFFLSINCTNNGSCVLGVTDQKKDVEKEAEMRKRLEKKKSAEMSKVIITIDFKFMEHWWNFHGRINQINSIKKCLKLRDLNANLAV